MEEGIDVKANAIIQSERFCHHIWGLRNRKMSRMTCKFLAWYHPLKRGDIHDGTGFLGS